MMVNMSITLQEWDTKFDLSPTEVADAVLKALGGDETKDVVNATVSGSGSAGAAPTPPPVPA